MKRDLNRFLIINADDFGLSTTVNEGIIDSYTNGIVTSTSMMLTMSSFEHAFNKAEEFPDLDIGIHIDLSWGNPLSKPVDIPSLVNSNGKFIDISFTSPNSKIVLINSHYSFASSGNVIINPDGNIKSILYTYKFIKL